MKNDNLLLKLKDMVNFRLNIWSVEMATLIKEGLKLNMPLWRAHQFARVKCEPLKKSLFWDEVWDAYLTISKEV